MYFETLRTAIRWATYIFLLIVNRYTNLLERDNITEVTDQKRIEELFVQSYNNGTLEWQNVTEAEDRITFACMVNYFVYQNGTTGTRRCSAGLGISDPRNIENEIVFVHVRGQNIQPHVIVCKCYLQTPNDTTPPKQFVIAKISNNHQYFHFLPVRSRNYRPTLCSFKVKAYYDFSSKFIEEVERGGQFIPAQN